MKTLNFLSNLWSLLVGSRKDDSSTRLRVDYDSFTCRLRVWPLKLVSVLVLVLTLGIGNAWGATETTYKWTMASGDLGSTSTASGSSGTKTSGGVTWSYTRTLKSGVTYTGFTSSCIQLGKNGGVDNVTISTSGISGTIKSVAVECSSYNNAHKVAISVGGTSYLAATATPKWTTVNTKSGSGTSSGKIVISFTNGSRALYIKSITVVYEAAPACTAPNHVDISGNWDKFGGETISLTAAAYSSAGTGSPIADANINGWQWQKLVNSTWTNVTGDNVSGATTKNLQITSCTKDNSGKYRCVVSTGATCSTASATKTDGTEGYGVKVYVLECYNSGTTVYNFTRTGTSQAGTVEIPLSASTNYTFKIHADADYYGNSGTVNEDATNWVMTTGESSNLTVASGLGGTFTFSMDYSSGGNNSTVGIPELSVTYPRKTIYLTPGVWNADGAKYAIYYFRDGGSSGWTDLLTANDCGMSAEIPQWNGVKVDAVRLNSSATSGNWTDKWNQTSDITISSNNSIVITGWNESDYNYTTYALPTYTISYAKGSVPTGGGSITGSKADESKTCGTAFTLPSSAVFTTTGYTQDGWATEDGGSKDYNLGGSYTTNAAQAFYPHWNANNYTLTWNLDGGTVTTAGTGAAVDATGSPSSSVAYYTAITAPVVEKEGYNFTGWNTTPATNMPATNTTYTAQWSLKSYTVTWYAGGTSAGNITTAGSPTTNVNHGSKVTTLPTNPDGSGCDKVFVGWTNTTSYTHGTSLLFNDVAGSPTINADASFYAVYATESGSGSESYKKVIDDDDITDTGRYLIVNETSEVVFDGNLTNLNVESNVVSITDEISAGVITITDDNRTNLANAEFTIDMTNLYIKSHSNKYINHTAYSNGMNTCSDDAKAVHSISINGSGDFVVEGTGQNSSSPNDYVVLRWNSNSGSGNWRFRFYKGTQNAIQLYEYDPGVTYTGHTITCSDCGTSVTPTFTAAPTGGTVAVTKGGSAVTSGDAVKTCTSQDLSVTITPASHYTLTGFTATGLTTGTATISPAVGSTLPKTVATTFTVTVSASATGTLNLTPTFTPETPLTITLNTNGKGTYTDPAEWPIYAGESFTLPDVTPSDPTCATFVGWIQGTTFPGDATTHDAPLTISAGSSSGELSVNTTYTAVFYETETAESDAYVKVTSAPVNWANDHYLIVYEDGGVAFDGSLSTLDASSNTVAVSISSGAIAATSALAASEWKIALISGSNYSIQSASGKYIGNASNSNGLTADNTALGNTLSISSENFGVVSAGGAYLRYNATSGQERFRYYKSSSYSSQQAIQLYKLGTAVVETRTYTTNPACTPKYRVTVASVTGGSPNANPKFLPENEEVTLTANPAAGYSFTSWTITKTTGGDDVTTTLLGANATTANTSFSMPAYDVTVTASYAKIPVASLQVKDGETVIANSGTVNISTGANKTLTVVVTPADAFDHSWSASVTGGGTYASITNVQAGTFQVNGLAQGDATVTVTAPNDGDAKTVTFTVHVTDILPTEVVLKRDGSNTSISELSIYEGQYVKVNVSFTPTPTNKDFSVSADGTFVTIHAQAHTNPNYYATLNGKKVTTSPVNVTFTSAATSSVTKNLVVTVLPLLTDTFVDYIHGQATQTVSARLSVDKYTLYTDINTPSLSDASDADPTSADCETSHYHLIGWLPKATAEALWAAGTAITESTEGLVKAGVQVEAIGQTWYAIWGKEQ